MSELKNYTSSVPMERSVQLIEQELIELGATNIMKRYEKGELAAITFQIDMQGDACHLIPISLPARIEKVEAYMAKHLRLSGDKLKDQARRTAWKSLLEWVQIQAGFIKVGRVEILEVFLAYVWRDNQTYYSELKNGKFLALENKP